MGIVSNGTLLSTSCTILAVILHQLGNRVPFGVQLRGDGGGRQLLAQSILSWLSVVQIDSVEMQTSTHRASSWVCGVCVVSGRQCGEVWDQPRGPAIPPGSPIIAEGSGCVWTGCVLQNLVTQIK